MKVRKLAVALALAGGLGSGVAQALGLGEIELQSYLNQPLNAEINVNRAGGVSPDDIVVNLASESDYERVGLRRDHFLTQLDFSVTTGPDGELVISVSSKEPVREPYLNFLVEVAWPSGRVMREYSVLVDPPVYAEESGEGEQVQPAGTGQQAADTQQDTAPQESSPQQQPASRDSASGTGPRTLDPVQASDTLWEIARSVRPDSSVSMQQVMLALQDLNEDAFLDGNINRLKRGAVLRVPDMDDIRARTQAEANREVEAQNRALAQTRSEPEPSVDATEDRAAAGDGAQGTGEASEDELRLVVPDETGEEARTEGSAGGDGRQQGTADAGDAVALEELDRVQRENEELNSRLEDLQDQVETLQRLIELKDTQLAEIQDAAGQDEGEAGTSPDDNGAQAGDDTGQTPVDEADSGSAGEDGEATVADAGEPEAAGDESASAEDTAEAGAAEEAGAETAAADGEQGEPATDPAAGDEAGQQPDGDDAVPATGAQPEDQQAQPSATEQPEQEKSFVATAVDLIAGNFMYQIALGGLLVLLLLIVLLISRRRASNENDFYQQLQEETGDDSFELSLGEEAAAASAGVLEEADRYISYGQHDAAAEVLENAISREPSRSDLRLKLLAVYADTGNRAAFDKQYAELEAMELDEAQPEAEAMRARLAEVESTPSIDELESQLREGDRFDAPSPSAEEPADTTGTPADDQSNERMGSFEELDLPEDEPEQPQPEEDDDRPIDYDFSSLDTSEGEVSEEPEPEDRSGEEDAGSIDFELPEDETELTGAEEDTVGESMDLEDDFSSLELDEAGIDDEPQSENVEGAADIDEEDELDLGDLELEGDAVEGESVDRASGPEEEADLDESFLDELDAELDKMASGEGTEEGATERTVEEDSDGLDDLELDVSDEDLALMDQASESEPEDESQLDLGDLDLEEGELEEGELDDKAATGESAEDDELSDLEIPELDSDLPGETSEAAPADTGRQGDSASIDEIDEAALGEDDDFDFLSGTDEVATKLDLARAYVDMGDSEGAREILEEVILEGSDEQKSDAQSLLKKLP